MADQRSADIKESDVKVQALAADVKAVGADLKTLGATLRVFEAEVKGHFNEQKLKWTHLRWTGSIVGILCLIVSGVGVWKFPSFIEEELKRRIPQDIDRELASHKDRAKAAADQAEASRASVEAASREVGENNLLALRGENEVLRNELRAIREELRKGHFVKYGHIDPVISANSKDHSALLATREGKSHTIDRSHDNRPFGTHVLKTWHTVLNNKGNAGHFPVLEVVPDGNKVTLTVKTTANEGVTNMSIRVHVLYE
ncbi:MAG TPA: hypothetical protein VD866_05090 [Urbifossiella sp.]|nr:hypothetical protein [Urbifossiella sp.]